MDNIFLNLRKISTRKLINIFFLSVGIAVVFASCMTSKYTYNFQTLKKDTTISAMVSENGVLKIRKDDRLAITVSSSNKEEDILFNAVYDPLSGYLVNAEGNIEFHKIGKIHAEGLTIRELKEKIEKSIEPYLKDAIVNVKFFNHRVIVMGEVTHAQTILLQDDKINILEALSMCGDLTKDADRSDILVMRENGQGTKEVKHINLENHSVFTSPVYFLQPNDILYVHPNDYTLKNLGRAKRQAIVTTVLTVLSIVIIVVDRIIKR